MSIHDQDQSAIAREILAQGSVHADADVSASALWENGISIQSRSIYRAGLTTEAELYEPADTASLPIAKINAAILSQALRQLETLAKRQVPRIAFKAKGKILFLDLAEIMAVQAEGNYVSLLHPPNTYLLRESLSSMAEKFKPYGFVRIHRSVVVNISAVEQIQPMPTGEYRLRVKGGKEYLVTRTYKENIRDLAQLWVG